jgi:hypothetical protein
MRLAARTWTQLRGEFRKHVKDNSEQLLRHPTLAWSLPIRDQRGDLSQPYVHFCMSVLVWTLILYMWDVTLQMKVQNLNGSTEVRWEDKRVLRIGFWGAQKVKGEVQWQIVGGTDGKGWGTGTNCCHHCNKPYSVVETVEILNHVNDWLHAALGEYSISASWERIPDPIPAQTPTVRTEGFRPFLKSSYIIPAIVF